MKNLNEIKEVLKTSFPSVKFINEAENYICYEVSDKRFEAEKNYSKNVWETYTQTGSDNAGYDKHIAGTL